MCMLHLNGYVEIENAIEITYMAKKHLVRTSWSFHNQILYILNQIYVCQSSAK